MGIFKSPTIVNRADKISNFTVNTAEFGTPVMEILGTTRIGGNVIYYDDFTAHEHRETQRAGKGGGAKTVTITYTYTAAVIIGLCEGPITGIGKVWVGKEVYTYPNSKIGLTLFTGTQEQSPWAYVVGKHPEKARAYKGLAYMAGVIDLGNSANMPNHNFEVKGKLLSTGDGKDVNPADYILYILDKIGLGDVEVVGIENYRLYCKNADLLISTPKDATDQKSARDIVNEIASLTNAYMFWSNDRFKIVPRADRPIGDWAPNKTITYDLTPDDFIAQNGGACVSYQRKDSSELYNRFTVEYTSRENDYETESVSYEDMDDINARGLRQASTTQASYIYTKKRAVMIAEQLARQNKYERNKYTFKLPWEFCRLEVGDLVTLTDPAIGLDKQVAMIDSVTEAENGILTFTAISRAAGDYSAAVYDVHEVDRPYVDFNADPGDTDTPIIFQPPSDLTSNGNELWIGAKGKTTNWGGCTVYVSDNNTTYRRLGMITNNARMGQVVSAISATATSVEVAVNGQFISGSEQDAERANTLCWVDGECMSYTTATLLSNGHYQLSGLVRGQYNTEAKAHASGAQFVRCDDALLKAEVRKEDVGKKVWVKFASYNVFGAGEQSLADVDAYEYVIQPYYIPPVVNLTSYNRYRQLVDGVARYDIVVKWDKPNMATYLQGEVWYKTNHEQAERLVIAEGVSADELGWQGEWIYGGSGVDQAVISQAIVGDTYRIAVTTKDEYGVSTMPDFAPQTTITVALKSNIPNTPDGFSIDFGEQAIASWNEVTNTDIALYEVRLDTNAGEETAALLARTNGLSVLVPITERQGTLYLFAKNAMGKYSEPAILMYKKAEPPKPKAPTVTSKLGGMAITAEPVPNGCKGINYYINDVLLYSVNNIITYTCDAGIYDVTVAYVDMFGVGPQSDKTRCVVEVKISGDMLEDEAITLSKVDANIKASLDKVETNAEGLLELSKNTNDNFLHINQSIDGINTVINSHDESISQLNITASELNSIIVSNKNAQDTINQNMASSIQQTSQNITAIVTELGKNPEDCSYSAISQLQNNINLRVEKDKVISQINLSPETITIDGKLLHITGDTLIDNNVIVGGMIKANSIDASKLNVSSLSAICATIGELKTADTGARVVIKDNLIQVYDANNIPRVQIGVIP